MHTILDLAQLRGERRCSLPPPRRPERYLSFHHEHAPIDGGRIGEEISAKFLSLEDLQRALEQQGLSRNTERTARRECERDGARGRFEDGHGQ